MTLYVGTVASSQDRAVTVWVGTPSGNQQATTGWVGDATGNRPFLSAAPPPPQAYNTISPASQTVTASPGQSVTFNALTSSSDGNNGAYTFSWFVRIGTTTVGSGQGRTISFQASNPQAGQTVNFTIYAEMDYQGGFLSNAQAAATLKT